MKKNLPVAATDGCRRDQNPEIDLSCLTLVTFLQLLFGEPESF